MVFNTSRWHERFIFYNSFCVDGYLDRHMTGERVNHVMDILQNGIRKFILSSSVVPVLTLLSGVSYVESQSRTSHVDKCQAQL